MKENTIKLIERTLRVVGYCWAAIGFVIVVISNAIHISGSDVEFWFIPINVRDHALTALLLVAPALLLVIGIVLKRMFLSTNEVISEK